jgi:predicted enzyme related to lactoylglutathione lyase
VQVKEKLGIELDEEKKVPGVIRFIDFSDPDGNRLSIYQLL